MGGARDGGALGLSDAELSQVADRELGALLGLCSGPSFVHIVRHARALPQYTLGHLERVAELGAGEARHPGLFFHGNAYHNAGVPELVSRSHKLAARIAAFVRGAT
jgi:oxygen-dependent protoporphyrinogen oxidase